MGYDGSAGVRSNLLPPSFSVFPVTGRSGGLERAQAFFGGGSGASPVTTPVPIATRIHAPTRLEVASQMPARVIPAPARTRGSNTSFATMNPRSTATIGFTNPMYEREVASIRFRSQRYVTNATTDPATLR